jgi:hypothetical protein
MINLRLTLIIGFEIAVAKSAWDATRMQGGARPPIRGCAKKPLSVRSMKDLTTGFSRMN